MFAILVFVACSHSPPKTVPDSSVLAPVASNVPAPIVLKAPTGSGCADDRAALARLPAPHWYWDPEHWPRAVGDVGIGALALESLNLDVDGAGPGDRLLRLATNARRDQELYERLDDGCLVDLGVDPSGFVLETDPKSVHNGRRDVVLRAYPLVRCGAGSHQNNSERWLIFDGTQYRVGAVKLVPCH